GLDIGAGGDGHRHSDCENGVVDLWRAHFAPAGAVPSTHRMACGGKPGGGKSGDSLWRGNAISGEASAVVNQRHLSPKCDLLGNALGAAPGGMKPQDRAGPTRSFPQISSRTAPK